MSHDVETSSGNVYADLGEYDAEQMQLKAQLAMVIGETLQCKGLTQQQAAQMLGMTQPKLSNLLRGQFRGISEAKMLECLVKLGRDVEIVVGKEGNVQGTLKVSFG
ncbi:helix-turn-helix domain-containing protein [Citrobacter sp. A316]|uniref:helix-turn-helix domain-containing protein n=1 Tax=Citrobacter freundii complex TaxID=1344959 RepID=UPI0009ACE7DE|nr:helix-turn-helix transcriptional regulator [Citrobacter sp. A316]MBJ9839618.1 XRE family transcriptional regulator [Citrobacter freundii]OPW93755.1 transcriptional regulator [Citrobacter sp. A316]QMN55963.1 XRE family transcriptional regulator [Citrobacter freundii]